MDIKHWVKSITFRKWLRRSLFLLGICVPLLFVTVQFNVFRVSSVSMAETLNEGDYVIVRRFVPSYIHRSHKPPHPSRGQVILFCLSDIPNEFIIKRVIAVGGDRIEIDHGNVILNGVVLREPYRRTDTEAHFPSESWPIIWTPTSKHSFVVPELHCFVLGDNRSNSIDSRSWGAVPYEDVFGVATFVVHGWSLKML
jgi:signal peptidase I